MIAISSHFTKRIRRALSNLSASWPLVAERMKRPDEERADHEAGERHRVATHLQLVGDEDGERELEQVVVALGPEEGREAALAEQREAFGCACATAVRQARGNVGLVVEAVLRWVCMRLRAAGNLPYHLNRVAVALEPAEHH